MKNKKISFKALYVTAGVLPMLISAIIIAIFSMRLVNKEVQEGEYEKLESTARNLAEYFAYDVRENGSVDYDEYSDHVYVNSLLDMDIEQTLFQDDVRFLTSLKKEDGSYNEGSTANPDIWATVKSGEEYSAENVDIGGKDYFVYYYPIYKDAAQTEVWGMAFAGTPMENVNRIIKSVRTTIFVIAVICVVLVTIVLYVFGNVLTNHLIKIKEDVQEFAEGNIAPKQPIDSLCLDFQEIGDAIVVLQDKLSEAIMAIKQTSSELGNSVEHVDELSVSNASGASQITEVVDELARTAQTMAENVQEANTSVIVMGNSIENITDLASTASSKATNMRVGNNEALKNMQAVFDSNEKSVAAILEINEQTAACTEAVNNIKQAADVIADIASQTNLLALNASIEAARAGESGRGFAVVAESIGQLANQSEDSVKEIGHLVEDIVAKVKACTDVAVDAKVLMEEQQKLVQSASDEMVKLNDAVTAVVEGINSVTTEAASLDKEKLAVLSNISDLSAISEENAASAEEVSATIESIAEGISGTKVESGQMKGMAVVLAEKVEFFK